MTELLHALDSYVQEFAATIVESTEAGVVLDRTAFFPGGGGQPADHGTLRTDDGTLYEVSGASRGSSGPVYRLTGPERPPVGSTVHGTLDWDRRYRLMRTHTALHILCGVVWRDYRALVTGGNMEPGRGHLDFEFERMQRELVEEIEEKINLEVQAARPIEVKILPRDEAFRIPDLIRTKINLLPEGITEVRIVDIVDLDLQADGGTHVANTREVGPLRITKYKSKGRANKRLTLELQDPALG